MPRATANPCSCGCGQPATTVRASPGRRVVVQGSRTRVAQCAACGATIRSTRADFAAGVHACRCGLGALLPICLHDRVALSGAEGERAWVEYAGRETEHHVRSENGRKGGVARGHRAQLEAARRQRDRDAGREPAPF